MNSPDWQGLVLLCIGAGIAYIVLQHPSAGTPLMAGSGVIGVLLVLLDRDRQP